MTDDALPEQREWGRTVEAVDERAWNFDCSAAITIVDLGLWVGGLGRGCN